MNLGNTAINNFMLGNIQIDKIYMGSLAAWTSMPYVYDEDLIYDNTNIEVSFPNSGNAGIDSTGNVLTATASDGVAISILKTQDKPTTIIPLMIDNTSPLGVASDIDSSSLAWKAFDEESAALSWSRNAQGGIGWVQYDFGYSIQADSYGMIQYITDDRAIKDFIIQGSDNGSAWTTIDTQSGLTSWEYDVEKYFTLSTPETYRYWRIDITASNGNATVVLGNFRLYSELGYGDYIALTSDNIPFEADFEFANISDASTADTLRTSTPIADGDNLVIVKDDNSINEMVASGVSEVPVSAVDIDDIFGDGSILETYQFNGNMNSLSGNNNGAGTLSNYIEGTFGQGGYFDETVYGEMDTPLSQMPIRSFSAWIFNIGASVHLIGTATGDYAMLQLSTDSYGKLRGGIYRDDTTGGSISTTEGTQAGWNHVVVTANPDGDTKPLVYLKKVSLGYTSSGSGGLAPSTVSFGQLTGFEGASAGGLDQVRFFNRIITQEEVNKLYDEESTAFQVDTTSVTAGEVPSRGYAVDAQPSFAISGGFEDAVKSGDTYEAIKAGFSYTLNSELSSLVLLDKSIALTKVLSGGYVCAYASATYTRFMFLDEEGLSVSSEYVSLADEVYLTILSLTDGNIMLISRQDSDNYTVAYIYDQNGNPVGGKHEVYAGPTYAMGAAVVGDTVVVGLRISDGNCLSMIVNNDGSVAHSAGSTVFTASIGIPVIVNLENGTFLMLALKSLKLITAVVDSSNNIIHSEQTLPTATSGIQQIDACLSGDGTVVCTYKDSDTKEDDTYAIVIGTDGSAIGSEVYLGSATTGSGAYNRVSICKDSESSCVIAAPNYQNSRFNLFYVNNDGSLIDSYWIDSPAGDFRAGILPRVNTVSSTPLLCHNSSNKLQVVSAVNATESFKTTRTYNDLIDPVGSQTVQSKVTLKAGGDKCTKLQASIMAKG